MQLQSAPGARLDLASVAAELKAGRPEAALILSERALKSHPEDFRLWSLRGLALDQMEQADEALSSYKQALSIAPDFVPALQGAAQTAYAIGDASALELIKRILELNPGDETSHAMLAVIAYRQRDCPTAIAEFQKSGSRAGSDKLMLEEQGVCYTQMAQFQNATTVFQARLSRAPEDADARYNLALSKSLSGQPSDARETLAPLLKGTSISSDVLDLEADLLQQQGKIPAAVEVLREDLSQHPDDVEGYLRFAALANDTGSYQTGVTLLNIGVERLSKVAPLYVARGILYGQLYEYDQAVADFDRAYRLDPSFSMTSAAEGVMLSQRQQGAASVESFRDALKRKPDDALTQYLLAEALSERNAAVGTSEYKEEIAAAKRALELDPKLVAAHDLLSAVFLRDGRSDLAIRHSEAALAIDAKDQQALYHLILALRGTSRKGEVPGLLKRLTDLRQATETEGKKTTRYRLSSADRSTQ